MHARVGQCTEDRLEFANSSTLCERGREAATQLVRWTSAVCVACQRAQSIARAANGAYHSGRSWHYLAVFNFCIILARPFSLRRNAKVEYLGQDGPQDVYFSHWKYLTMPWTCLSCLATSTSSRMRHDRSKYGDRSHDCCMLVEIQNELYYSHLLSR